MKEFPGNLKSVGVAPEVSGFETGAQRTSLFSPRDQATIENKNPSAGGNIEADSRGNVRAVDQEYEIAESTVSADRDVWRRIAKRFIDLVLASIGLIVSFPFFVLLAILIRLDSQGPAFYCQSRVGANTRRRARRASKSKLTDDERIRDRRRVNNCGQVFTIIKFRTMILNAEKKSGPVWAIKDDPRTTRIGALLRRTRMDELPQLINVLKGDMSIVGPRPERPMFVNKLKEQIVGYERRLEFKPGITGLAQVENGYDSSVRSVAEKVRTDIRYIENWSLWGDIKILFRTVKVVISGKGAN